MGFFSRLFGKKNVSNEITRCKECLQLMELSDSIEAIAII